MNDEHTCSETRNKIKFSLIPRIENEKNSVIP